MATIWSIAAKLKADTGGRRNSAAAVLAKFVLCTLLTVVVRDIMSKRLGKRTLLDDGLKKPRRSFHRRWNFFPPNTENICAATGVDRYDGAVPQVLHDVYGQVV